MSNVEDKEVPSLAVVFARELAELMGGNPSRLHKWGKALGLPLPSARQTFYSHLAHRWEMESEPALTETCRLGSYPMSCELRLRVVSVETQFRQDIRADRRRQVIVLLGYEVCSHLIHFRVYRGPDYENENEDEHGMPLCKRLPVALVAAFVRECGRMVGLPLRRVLLTQDLMDFRPAKGKAAFLSLTQGHVTVRKPNDEADDNEVMCSFGSKQPYRTLVGDHPFIDWCRTTNATKLTADLSNLVKRHNKTIALPRLEDAQRVLDALLSKSHDAVEARRGSSRWAVPQSSFEERVMKHVYALERYSLHEVRFFRRQLEKPQDFPAIVSR